MKTKHEFSFCYECLEGYRVGDRIYCSYGGCFHQLYDPSCKRFNSKNLALMSQYVSKSMLRGYVDQCESKMRIPFGELKLESK